MSVYFSDAAAKVLCTPPSRARRAEALPWYTQVLKSITNYQKLPNSKKETYQKVLKRIKKYQKISNYQKNTKNFKTVSIISTQKYQKITKKSPHSTKKYQKYYKVPKKSNTNYQKVSNSTKKYPKGIKRYKK